MMKENRQSLRDIRKTLISATAIAVLIIRAKIYIEGKETCAVIKAFRNTDKKSLCRFSSWGRGGGVGVGISENSLKHEQDRRGQKKRKGFFAWVLF